MIVRLATHAMGTRFELVLDGPDEVALRAIGEEAIDEIEECHGRLSLFDRASTVALLNREAGARPVRVDPDTFGLLRLCAGVHADSGGVFDPTVGPLMSAWGFRGEPRPSVEDAASLVGMERVDLDAERMTVRFEREGMAIDLGGIAKGHALDRATEVVRGHGVARAMLHGGTSTIVAIGSPPGLDGWPIQLPGGARVALRDRALSVSAPGGRVVETPGGSIGHVVDPRSGRPAPGAPGGAAVCESATLADAWSTALVVAARRPAGMPASITSLIDDARAWRVAGSTDGLWFLDGDGSEPHAPRAECSGHHDTGEPEP